MGEEQFPQEPDPIQHLDFEPQLPAEAQVDEAEAIIRAESVRAKVENWGRYVPPVTAEQQLADMQAGDQRSTEDNGAQDTQRIDPREDPKNWGKWIPPEPKE